MSKQLENEVWNLERCAGCGACVAACSKRILYFEGDVDHPSKKVVRKTVGLSTTVLDVCHFCEMAGEKLCELSCPRMQEDWPDGPVQREVLVRTTGQIPSGFTNEIVSNLLAGAMRAALTADLGAMGARAFAYAESLDWGPIAAQTAALYRAD